MAMAKTSSQKVLNPESPIAARPNAVLIEIIFYSLWRQARPIRAFHAAAGGAGGVEDASERTATREEDLSPQG
jgi:hypothetical protein